MQSHAPDAILRHACLGGGCQIGIAHEAAGAVVGMPREEQLMLGDCSSQC